LYPYFPLLNPITKIAGLIMICNLLEM